MNDTNIMSEENQFKYLEVIVSRPQSTTVFIRVPADFEVNKVFRSHKAIKAAVEETVKSDEWETDFIPEYDVSEIKQVTLVESTFRRGLKFTPADITSTPAAI